MPVAAESSVAESRAQVSAVAESRVAPLSAAAAAHTSADPDHLPSTHAATGRAEESCPDRLRSVHQQQLYWQQPSSLTHHGKTLQIAGWPTRSHLVAVPKSRLH